MKPGQVLVIGLLTLMLGSQSGAAEPLVSLWFYPSAAIVTSNSVMAILLLWRHRSNISNLVNGRENKLGSKKTG